MPWLKQLNVIFDDYAKAEIEVARKKYSRFDDGLNGLIWLLSRNAEPVGSFPTSPARDEFMYGFDGDFSAEIPEMWVVYSYDDNDLIVYAINAMDASDAAEPE